LSFGSGWLVIVATRTSDYKPSKKIASNIAAEIASVERGAVAEIFPQPQIEKIARAESS
jgi:hypothetical protein